MHDYGLNVCVTVGKMRSPSPAAKLISLQSTSQGTATSHFTHFTSSHMTHVWTVTSINYRITLHEIYTVKYLFLKKKTKNKTAINSDCRVRIGTELELSSFKA